MVEGEVAEEQVYDNSCYSHLQDCENIEFNWLLLCCAVISMDTKEVICENAN